MVVTIKKMPSCDMRCHVFWFFLKHDFTCSMREDICDSGHNILPVAQFLKMFILGSGFDQLQIFQSTD